MNTATIEVSDLTINGNKAEAVTKTTLIYAGQRIICKGKVQMIQQLGV